LPAYEKRAKEFGFASPVEIKSAIENPDSYVLDVRRPEEIAESAKVEHANWRQTSCTPDSCPAFEGLNDPLHILPDKNATIVVYCRSGRRAVRAIHCLKEKGYTGPIHNAGGYDDLKSQNIA